MVCKIEWRKGEGEQRKGVRSGQAKSPQFWRFRHLSSVEFGVTWIVSGCMCTRNLCVASLYGLRGKYSGKSERFYGL